MSNQDQSQRHEEERDEGRPDEEEE